jgi:hypothetical protein
MADGGAEGVRTPDLLNAIQEKSAESVLRAIVRRIGQSLRFRLSIQSVCMRRSHQHIDARNKLQDRLLAGRLRRNARILRQARSNLKRWIARDGRHPRRVFVEWQRILNYLSAQEIANFLTSDTPMAQRLRQSSPFMGLFPRSSQLRRNR